MSLKERLRVAENDAVQRHEQECKERMIPRESMKRKLDVFFKENEDQIVEALKKTSCAPYQEYVRFSIQCDISGWFSMGDMSFKMDIDMHTIGEYKLAITGYDSQYVDLIYFIQKPQRFSDDQLVDESVKCKKIRKCIIQ